MNKTFTKINNKYGECRIPGHWNLKIVTNSPIRRTCHTGLSVCVWKVGLLFISHMMVQRF